MEIQLGAFAPKIATQLMKQGYSFDPVVIMQIQKDSEDITRLFLRGYISQSQSKKAKDRIYKLVQKAITLNHPQQWNRRRLKN